MEIAGKKNTFVSDLFYSSTGSRQEQAGSKFHDIQVAFALVSGRWLL
jgi:hypothetical protein